MTLQTSGAPSNARSRRTRASLLDAARDILEQDGFEALTMTALADRAGVTRRSAYLHFPSRAALVGTLFDHLAAAEGLTESVARVWAAPDAGAALDAWAQHLATYHPRLLEVDRAVERVRHHDRDAAEHRSRVAAEKMRNCRRLACRLRDEGQLAAQWDVDSAADMLYGLISSDLIEALITDRRWSRARLAASLATMFRATFLIRPGRLPSKGR